MKRLGYFLTLLVEVQGVLIKKIPLVFRCPPDKLHLPSQFFNH